MRKSLLTLLSILPLTIAAQTTVTFDGTPADYKSVGVYDTWEASPFRTGALKGNAQVITNFTNDGTPAFPDKTSHILGVQRSRFGSNTFGVRIDLRQPWATSEQTQYVHVLVDKPNTSKVLLVGLGKRNTAAFVDEPTTVEQFWVESLYSYDTPGEWADMVFPVKTVSGVQVYSLVVVPDLRSPHNDTSDFACYIDQIEVNESSAQRLSHTSDYPVIFKGGSGKPSSSCSLTAVSLTAADGTVQSHTLAGSDPSVASARSYTDLTDSVTWDVKAGATYTPSIVMRGGATEASVYIDYNNDGQFAASSVSGDGSVNLKEMVSQSASSSTVMPSFTIPTGLQPGIYRLRYMTDCCCADLLLNVHGDRVMVNVQNRNGSVTAADGSALINYPASFKEPLTVVLTPAGGFDNDNLVIQHGYHLTGPQYIHGNRQWQSVTYPAKDYPKGQFTIPATLMDGDVNIDGNFKQKGRTR